MYRAYEAIQCTYSYVSRENGTYDINNTSGSSLVTLTEEKGVADDDPRHEVGRVSELELGAAISHSVDGLSLFMEFGIHKHTPQGSIRCFFHGAAWL